MNTVMIRNVEVGTGMPKVIVPIVEKSQSGILAKAQELANIPFHLVEWRADFYEDVFEIDKVLDTLKAMNRLLGDKPILFTFRTKAEGGERAISPEEYTRLNVAVAQSGYADAVDVEIFMGDQVVKTNIDAIHAAGKVVVGSNHDFNKTPDKADLLYRLRRMQDMGADIPKIAVMPQSPSDVIVLLDASQEMHNRYADRPIITMSMASGVISRLCGECFGSSMTFGAVGSVSAPGQISIDQLTTAMNILHDALAPKT